MSDREWIFTVTVSRRLLKVTKGLTTKDHSKSPRTFSSKSHREWSWDGRSKDGTSGSDVVEVVLRDDKSHVFGGKICSKLRVGTNPQPHPEGLHKERIMNTESGSPVPTKDSRDKNLRNLKRNGISKEIGISKEMGVSKVIGCQRNWGRSLL